MVHQYPWERNYLAFFAFLATHSFLSAIWYARYRSTPPWKADCERPRTPHGTPRCTCSRLDKTSSPPLLPLRRWPAAEQNVSFTPPVVLHTRSKASRRASLSTLPRKVAVGKNKTCAKVMKRVSRYLSEGTLPVFCRTSVDRTRATSPLTLFLERVSRRTRDWPASTEAPGASTILTPRSTATTIPAVTTAATAWEA